MQRPPLTRPTLSPRTIARAFGERRHSLRLPAPGPRPSTRGRRRTGRSAGRRSPRRPSRRPWRTARAVRPRSTSATCSPSTHSTTRDVSPAVSPHSITRCVRHAARARRSGTSPPLDDRDGAAHDLADDPAPRRCSVTANRNDGSVLASPHIQPALPSPEMPTDPSMRSAPPRVCPRCATTTGWRRR